MNEADLKQINSLMKKAASCQNYILAQKLRDAKAEIKIVLQDNWVKEVLQNAKP